MNIGSKDVAENPASIFSLIGHCKIKDINSQNNLRELFECILHDKGYDKKALYLFYKLKY